VTKPRPKPKPKAKKEKKKKDLEEDLDEETRRRRALMKQKVNDFEAASTLFGDAGDSRKLPVAHIKPKTADEYKEFASAIVDVIGTFAEHSKYVDFLLQIVRQVKDCAKHESLERLREKVAVLHNERVKEEKSGVADDTRKKKGKTYKTKKDDMDAALDGRNRRDLDDEFDFM
jgi:hypothetical protein